jgi:hypothetical protein
MNNGRALHSLNNGVPPIGTIAVALLHHGIFGPAYMALLACFGSKPPNFVFSQQEFGIFLWGI